MSLFKSVSGGDQITMSAFSENDTMNDSPNALQSHSLESPMQDQWQINPELPHKMYMPCVATTSASSRTSIKQQQDTYLNKLYILGSHNNNQCWLYDTTYKTYEKLPCFPKKLQPKGHCIASCEHLVFSTGGPTECKHLLFYNTISCEWHTAPNSRAKDFGIGCKCVVVHNKQLNNSMELHVIGGNRKPNRYYIYNRAMKQWREGPKLPLKLTYHGLVYVGRQNHARNALKAKGGKMHRSQLIVFGGCNMKKGWTSSLAPTTKMYRLYLDSAAEDADSQMVHEHNEQHVQHGEDQKYAGNDDDEDPHDVHKWRHIGDLPVAVQNFAYLCVLNNFILIFGGDLGDYKCSRNIYVYNIERKTWKLLGLKLPDHLYGLSAVETSHGVIHLFGGHNGKSSQRLHISIKTSHLLAKEFDDFNASKFTWMQLSAHSGDHEDESILDELKRVKRKLKDLQENYNLKLVQCEQLMEENKGIKQTNFNLLDKLGEAMQEKDEISTEMQHIKRTSRSKSPLSSPRSPRTPRSSSKSKKQKKRDKHLTKYNILKLYGADECNPYIDVELMEELKMNSEQSLNLDPKYIMFRNFLFGRIGLPGYLNEFKAAKFANINKMIELNDQNLKLQVGISNDLHRKLILKVINEFKLEIIQFKSWISSYGYDQFMKPLSKYGIITWHLLAQHISKKQDFSTKLYVNDEQAVECLYEHLQQFLDGQIPQPHANKRNGNEEEAEKKKKAMMKMRRKRW